MELFQIHDAESLQMFIFLHLTAVAAVDFSSEGRGVPLEAIASEFGFLVAELDGLAYLFLAFGEDGRLGECYLHFVGLSRVRAFGGVGLGVVAGSLVFLLGLALEEIEGFVHGWEERL